VLTSTQRRTVASRALDRLAGFQAEEGTLGSVRAALEDADASVRAATEKLQDAFVDVLAAALRRPGVARGDTSALRLDSLMDRIAKLEKGVSALPALPPQQQGQLGKRPPPVDTRNLSPASARSSPVKTKIDDDVEMKEADEEKEGPTAKAAKSAITTSRTGRRTTRPPPSVTARASYCTS
jgi:hypothetical protein